jgi:hyperosmotically inducible periplasmic protein
MRRLSGILGAATLVVFLIALGACTTTQTPGTQIDDATIHTAVKAKLTTDHFSNIVNIDINVTNGIVTLAGEVPNPQVRLEAEKEALSVNGVKKVINNLQVKHPA